MMIYKNLFNYELDYFMQDKVISLINSLDKRYSKKGDLIISSIEDINNIIYKFSKFNLISTKKDCGGYFCYYTQEIAINTSDNNNFDNITTMLHELGHYYQYTKKKYKEIDIVDELIFEQEAEGFACRIIQFLKLKYNNWKSFEYEPAYCSKLSIEFLNEWHNYKKDKNYYKLVNLFNS